MRETSIEAALYLDSCYYWLCIYANDYIHYPYIKMIQFIWAELVIGEITKCEGMC